MSKYNTKTPGTKTVNLAGGEAYSQTPELEFVSILLTSFADDSYYRKGNETIERMKTLIAGIDPQFAAKAIVYARTQFGMRSITHVAASELAKRATGQKWAKDFYKAIVYRPDDMLEILSYHKQVNGKLSNAMKSGLTAAFDKFDAYGLGKYRGEGKAFKMIDAVNILHPKPTDKNAEAIKGLVDGTLRAADTWEVELSKVGSDPAAKSAAWYSLISQNKLGYFALLRNLRNILQDSPVSLGKAISLLTDERLIKKSLVLPFRFITAFDEISKLESSKEQRAIQKALVDAVDISLSNVPSFEGETLVVLDKSGSMQETGNKSPHIIGALFAAVLAKRNNADYMEFSEDAAYRNLNLSDSVVTLANGIRFASGGTNFHSIFQRANKKYDRIIILSDMQGWIGYDSPAANFKAYKGRHNADPFIYSFDLKNYGTMQFPERNVFAVAGFSEKVFDLMKYMESDKASLIKTIQAVEI
jgi:60 kDa SS-A/Ro ribonucleoprotein